MVLFHNVSILVSHHEKSPIQANGQMFLHDSMICKFFLYIFSAKFSMLFSYF